MNAKKLIFAGLLLTLFCVLARPGIALADEYNQATKLTFNEPVEVPGHVLDAGTYWFTLMDSNSDRDIVQIWNEDRSQLIGTVLTVADYRYKPDGKTVINFAERRGDQPEAIQAWFYPGEDFGHEFVYPKTRAVALANQTQQPVLSVPDEAAANLVSSSQPATSAVTSSGEELELSEVVQSEEPKENVVLASLPQTASSLPIWVLVGLFAIGASLCFRRVSRRSIA